MSQRLKFNYNASKDYNKLFELVQNQRVICIVTTTNKLSNGDSIEIKNVCSNTALANKTSISIGTKGIGYIDAIEFEDKSLKEDFIEQCEFYKLEYIDPEMVK